jgi:hypothetical protein
MRLDGWQRIIKKERVKNRLMSLLGDCPFGILYISLSTKGTEK